MRLAVTLLASASVLGAGMAATPAVAATPDDTVEGTILGGTPAKQGQFPFMSSLNKGCGASLVSEDIVITAQHCIFGSRNNLNIGDVNISKGTRRSSADLRKGPGPHKGDWAVIKLDKKVTDLEPVAVPTDDRFDSQKTFQTVGWGMTKERGRQQQQLRYVDVNYVPDDQCRGGQASAEICAGNGSATACKGDSGGPLLARDGDRQVLVGLTSWGDYDCARDGHPGHYAQVSSFIEPMKKAIRDMNGTMPAAWANAAQDAPAPQANQWLKVG